MKIRFIDFEVLSGELIPVVDVITDAWPSMIMDDNVMEAVLHALTLRADLGDVPAKMEHARRALAHNTDGKLLYEIGWKNNLRFLRLTSESNRKRELQLACKDVRDCDEERQVQVGVSIDFGIKGSEIQATAVLQELAPFERKFDWLKIITTEGETIRSIAGILEKIAQTMAGRVTYFNCATGQGIIVTEASESREAQSFFLHANNIADPELTRKLETLTRNNPALGERAIPVSFNDGGKIPGKQNNRALDAKLLATTG